MLVNDENNQQPPAPEDEPCSDIALRLQVLDMAKEVLQTKAAMRWETHKQANDITVEELIQEAIKIYDFVTARES